MVGVVGVIHRYYSKNIHIYIYKFIVKERTTSQSYVKHVKWSFFQSQWGISDFS